MTTDNRQRTTDFVQIVSYHVIVDKNETHFFHSVSFNCA